VIYTSLIQKSVIIRIYLVILINIVYDINRESLMENISGQTIVFIINSLRKMPVDLTNLWSEINQNTSVKSCTALLTKYAGHASELALMASNEKADLIIAIGGDGTFNEVLNGILKSGNPNTSLALIPNGTGNDFCRGQGIIYKVEKFMDALKNQNYIYYDAGVIIQGTSQRYFLNIADLGFGGHTAKILNNQRKMGLKGSISYSVAILRSFGSFRKPEVKIMADGKPLYNGKLMMLTVCNGDTFGSGLIIHPGAKPDDGLLNITLLGEVTLWDYVSNIFKLKKGIKIDHPNISYHTAKKISFTITKGNAFIESDGEIVGDGDAEISILPGSVKVLKY